MVIFYLLILCLCERTFQHSVYPVPPGLLRQPINYVTQVNCSFFFFFFFGKGLVCVVTLCVSPSFPLSLGLNCHSSPSARAHTHTKTTRVMCLEEPGLVFEAVWSCVFSGDRCVTSLTPGLCMWEMCQSPAESCDWLAGHTPPWHPAPPAASKPEVLRRSGGVAIATTTSGG